MNEETQAGALATPSHPNTVPHVRVVDPSDAVTGLGFVFGAIGALVGIVAAVFVSSGITLALVGYCLLAALAGGSAGVVVGGMIGAVLAVARGVTRHRDVPK
jgi:hypothetical protein